MKICEDFGPQSRCHCTDAHALDRALGRLGFAGRTPIAGW